MICETSRLNLKPSADRTVIVERLASSWCASVLPVAQLSTTLAVGTLVTWGVRVNWIFARIKRLNPYAFISPIHKISMPKGIAGDVFAFFADIGDHHTDMGDRHFRHVDQFDCGEARIDEIAAREQDLLL